MLSFYKGWPLYIALLLELWVVAICLSILWEYYKPYSEKKQGNAKNNQSPCEANNASGGNLGKLRSQYKNLGMLLGNIGRTIFPCRICLCINYFLTKLFNFCLKFFRVVHSFIYSQRKNQPERSDRLYCCC